MGKKLTARESEKQIKDLESRLTEQQPVVEKFSRAFYLSPIMMSITTLDSGHLVEINDSFASFLGFGREELIGQTTVGLNLWARPEERQKMVNMLENPKASGTMEISLRRKDGKKIVGYFTFKTFRLGGEKYILSTVTDITKHKETEKMFRETEHRYRSLVELSPVAMLVHSEGNIVFMNDEAVRLLGGTSAADFTGKPILDLVHPDFQEVGRRRIQDIYEKRRDAELLAEKFLRLDGEVIDVEVAGRIVDYQGKPASQMVIIDITERKRIEEEWQKVQKLESVGLLAGGIAHDFNNILTAVMGNITLSLLKSPPGSEVHGLLKSAEKAVLRASDLTQQLLTFSKGGDPIKEDAPIKELVMESANFVLRGSNVTCSCSFEDDILTLEVDKGQISQVIQNLILNAVQAMPGGGVVEVTVENAVLESGQVSFLTAGEYVKIAIRDHGIGIDKRYLQKIFDPYFTTKKKGSGLGLSIVYSILKKHNGTITVASEPGKGTVFTIYLPAAKKQEMLPSDARQKENFPARGSGTVLVMDDDPEVRDISALMLESLGYTATCVEDGKQALELYKKAKKVGHPFDVVIMDLTVPGGMGGEKAVKLLTAFDPNARVVVASGYSNDPVMANYKEYGFSGMLPKPVIMEDLHKLLIRLIKE
jgi:PAS domain S-box-containing protein